MKQKQPHRSEHDEKEVLQASSENEAIDVRDLEKSGPDQNMADTDQVETEKTGAADVSDIPGVSVVRSNTPRPLSYETLQSLSGHFQRISFDDALPMPSVFPAIAPSAPPLPEEFIEQEAADATATADSFDSDRSAANAPSDSTEKQGKPVATERETTSVGNQEAPGPVAEEKQDFVWLFEYGLEMDESILNSPERLAGLALRYGPAVLRGYRLVLGAQSFRGGTGSTIVAIVPVSDPAEEVWGVLYRVPRRCIESNENEPSLLDTIHAAIIPQKFFKGVEVVVHDTHREREVTSVTYVATDVASSQLHLVAADEWKKDHTFVQRLATIAREQQLPESYVEQFVREQLANMTTQVGEPVDDSQSADTMERHASDDMAEQDIFSHAASSVPMTDLVSPLPETIPSAHLSQMRASRFTAHATLPVSAPGAEDKVADRTSRRRIRLDDIQNTEPLSVVKEHAATSTGTDLASSSVHKHSDPWLLAFALYLVFLLLLALTFAILQGLGFMSGLFNAHFLPLGVPWLVMMYGLLGGCISSIITLGRFRADCPPAFIIITWFTRPFIGSILAVLSYVLLASGVFAMSANHMSLFLLVGALAGLAEGWVFFKWH